MNKKLSIAIGADHAGFDYKQLLNDLLKDYEVKDFGTFSADSVDYPDFAHPVAQAVENGEYNLGILICGSANGVAMTANKHAGIRAAICWNEELAELARNHNNANVLCIPARFTSPELAEAITLKFLTSEFEGGRHGNRVDKISC
ncbi:ribose 5-phosphate isomerase B [Daejeonella oryzae]|uniref:ribose 5-phosphate isomerase B n=1 Tax=Daejeonella oryzae TaxID=1122943 RepID=UPI0003F54CE3|nr:ribose 5-phosphate isomerase B [Daejeonella oryzae]